MHYVPYSFALRCFIEAVLSLAHCCQVTQTSVSELTITDSGNGLSPGRRQAIIWTNAGILLIDHREHISLKLKINFIFLIECVHTFLKSFYTYICHASLPGGTLYGWHGYALFWFNNSISSLRGQHATVNELYFSQLSNDITTSTYLRTRLLRYILLFIDHMWQKHWIGVFCLLHTINYNVVFIFYP